MRRPEGMSRNLSWERVIIAAGGTALLIQGRHHAIQADGTPGDMVHDAAGLLSFQPRTGKEVKEWGIHYTVTQATKLGRAVMEARARHDDPVQAVLDHEGGKQLFRGKVVDVARETTGGFLRGSTTIEGVDADRGSRMELAFQNEWAVAFRDGQPVAMTPDLLCLLDTVSGGAIGTESVRYGQRVTVVALPAPELLTTPAGIAAVGPRAFGYDIDFRSVFP